MTSPLEFISGKLYRAGEATDFLFRYAADDASRKAFWNIYSNLHDRSKYDDPVSLNLRVNGRIYPFHMRLSDIFILGEIFHENQYRLQSKLPSAPTIIDLGANIGVSAVWFLAQFPDAKIHSFEPAEDNLEFLNKNVAPYPSVYVEKAAVGDTSGMAMLHKGEFGGMHSLLIEGEGMEVPLITLADYMAEKNIKKIDLLKLDIEGSELDALKGLGDRVRDVDVIIGEVHEAVVDGDEFYRFLDEHGFEILWKRFFQESRAQQVHGFEAVRKS